jgi:hypothetical protein
VGQPQTVGRRPAAPCRAEALRARRRTPVSWPAPAGRWLRPKRCPVAVPAYLTGPSSCAGHPVAAQRSPSRSYVLASLRALHFDTDLPRQDLGIYRKDGPNSTRPPSRVRRSSVAGIHSPFSLTYRINSQIGGSLFSQGAQSSNTVRWNHRHKLAGWTHRRGYWRPQCRTLPLSRRRSRSHPHQERRRADCRLPEWPLCLVGTK